MLNNKLIFLIGFMGAGKTFVGKQLAEKMGLPFFDLDEYVEEKLSMTIPEVFEKEGEQYFRIEEQKCLRDFTVLGNAVVAAGGGTPCFFDNIDWMNNYGVTIYLKTPVDILAKRLIKDKEHRPLIANLDDAQLLDFITEKVAERSEYYEKASVIFEQKESEEDTVMAIMNHYLDIIGH